MNLKRFTARSSRDALALVKQAFGDDAVVMSTRDCADGGVEVLAMAPESVQQLERVGYAAPAEQPAPATPAARTALATRQPQAREAARETAREPARAQTRDHAPTPAPAALQSPLARQLDRQAMRVEPSLDAGPDSRFDPRLDPRSDSRFEQRPDTDVEQDLQQLEMSTLSFQEYVRQRMLKRRDAERAAEHSAAAAQAAAPVAHMAPVVAPIEAARARHSARRDEAAAMPRHDVPVLRDEVQLPDPHAVRPAPPKAAPVAVQPQAPALSAAVPQARQRGEQIDMMSELRSMRGLIEQRFGALAFMEKLQRQPRQAHLAQHLLDTGFSPALIRKLVTSLPANLEKDGDEVAWAANVLERNLHTGERDAALEESGGIYALIGATGVGKTTSTAKLAAAFATKHGAANLGLITLDAYRVGAHEQLRTYGRILGVPVHTAHDRASLEDLLDLLSAKRMVLIDTAGMAQRDSRTRELLDMLSHRAINRLLVVNASAQGETIEDQLAAYAAGSCRGVVLSKMDEAVKLGPALDSMIRHKLKVLAVANGQRVPEDWHRLSANALVQRALKGGGSPAWRVDEQDVNLIFAGMPALHAASQPAGVSQMAGAAAHA